MEGGGRGRRKLGTEGTDGEDLDGERRKGQEGGTEGWDGKDLAGGRGQSTYLIVTGVSSSIVVTLSRNAETTPAKMQRRVTSVQT